MNGPSICNQHNGHRDRFRGAALLILFSALALVSLLAFPASSVPIDGDDAEDELKWPATPVESSLTAEEIQALAPGFTDSYKYQFQYFNRSDNSMYAVWTFYDQQADGTYKVSVIDGRWEYWLDQEDMGESIPASLASGLAEYKALKTTVPSVPNNPYHEFPHVVGGKNVVVLIVYNPHGYIAPGASGAYDGAANRDLTGYDAGLRYSIEHPEANHGHTVGGDGLTHCSICGLSDSDIAGRVMRGFPIVTFYDGVEDGAQVFATAEAVCEFSPVPVPAPATDPAREGQTFMGWYDVDGDLWDFSTPVNASKSLYARWDPPVLAGSEFSHSGLVYRVLSADPASAELVGYKNAPRDVVVPSEVPYGDGPVPVVSVGAKAFYGCPTLASVDLGSVESVGMKAFANCAKLRTLAVPETVRSIGAYAFYGCGLTSLDIPGDGVVLGASAFSACKRMASITFSGHEAVIGQNAFYKNNGVSSVDLSTVASVGLKAFPYCYGLTALTIPGNISVVGEYAFYKCTSLKELVVEDGVRKIGKSAFSGCTALEGVSLPGSLVYIGPDAFHGLKFVGPDGKAMDQSLKLRGHSYSGSDRTLAMLEDLVDGEGFSVDGISYVVTSASSRAASITGYEGAPSAVPCTVAYKGWTLAVESVGSKALLGCGTLKSVDLSNVRDLGFKALGNCTGIEEIVFGEGLESIGDYALYGLSFYDGSVKLPATPDNLRGHAFSGAAGKLFLVKEPASAAKILVEDQYGVYFWTEGSGETIADCIASPGPGVTFTTTENAWGMFVNEINGLASTEDFSGYWSLYSYKDGAWTLSDLDVSSMMTSENPVVGFFYVIVETVYPYGIVAGGPDNVDVPSVSDAKAWGGGTDGTVFCIQSASGLFLYISDATGSTMAERLKSATAACNTPYEESRYGIRTLFGIGTAVKTDYEGNVVVDPETGYYYYNYWAQYGLKDGAWAYMDTTLPNTNAGDFAQMAIVYGLGDMVSVSAPIYQG